MRRLAASFAFALVALCAAFGQEPGISAAAAQGAAGAASRWSGGSAMATETALTYNERVVLALSNPEYPVTPGDAYTLTYLKASSPERLSVVVEGDGSINFGFFGRTQADGMRYRDLKSSVEKKVAESYPGSSPSLLIASTGFFQVKVEGEVVQASFVTAWGLSRLSEVLGSKTPYASTRDVTLVHSDGRVERCDLFLAERGGLFSSNPYLKPGDRVVLGRLERSVTVSGAVERPGTYQLLKEEGLIELVEVYGGGLLPGARADLGHLIRRAEPGRPAGAALQLDVREKAALIDGDVIHIPSSEEMLDVVYIEGAIQDPMATAGNGVAAGKQAEATGAADVAKVDVSAEYRVERHSYRAGELLSVVLRSVAGRLLPSAALRQGLVQRPGEARPIPVDMEALLYRYDRAKDVELRAGDRILIPFGAFDVFVTGEATKSTFVKISGLTRLRQAVEPLMTEYSSLRKVEIVSPSGDAACFDLFRAERYGDLDQDPILRPGDKVVIGRLERAASIAGAVERPGTYQLLPGEGLVQLVELYGGGFSERADRSRLDIARIVGAIDPSGERRLLDFSEAGSVSLFNRDTVNVPTLQDLLPIVFFEGAIAAGGAEKGTTPEPGISNRVPYPFYSGELLSSAIKANRERYSPEADLEKGYILRDGKRIATDFSRYIYDMSFRDSSILVAGDTLVIPFKQYFVSVGGAVLIPGRYPYVPDRSWRYYVGLAGGANQDMNSGHARTITGVDGNRKDADAPIEPEDSIVLASNNFLYIFSKYSAIVTAAASVFSIILAISNTYFP